MGLTKEQRRLRRKAADDKAKRHAAKNRKISAGALAASLCYDGVECAGDDDDDPEAPAMPMEVGDDGSGAAEDHADPGPPRPANCPASSVYD